LAAWILDATWQTLRSERAARAFPAWQTAHGEPPELLREFETIARLRRDFARLQEQPVLDNVSVGAVIAFLESIAQRGNALSGVTWDERDKRIVASFA
jgi:hypothetical protein